MAFWYQHGIAADQPELPYGAARLPQGNAQQIEVEKALDQVKAERGKATLSPELFWSKDVLLFEAEGPGAKVEVPFDAPAAGDYEVYAQLAQGSNYGIYSVLVDGRRPAASALEHEPGADVRPHTQFDGYAAETYVGADFPVGWMKLAQGRHTLTFVCLGKREASSGHALGVDTVVLAKTGLPAWSAASAVKAPSRPSGTAAEVGRALSDPDPVARGLAAIVLRDRGAEALPALPALSAALRDEDANVRLMSANALAGLGPQAAPAVPRTTAACAVPGEQVHVLRSCATALGAIGKAARPALPVLQGLVKLPRVQWAAEAAMHAIETAAR